MCFNDHKNDMCGVINDDSNEHTAVVQQWRQRARTSKKMLTKKNVHNEKGKKKHEIGKLQGFPWFIDVTVLAVTTGRDDKTVVKMERWSRPVPSRWQLHLPLTRAVPSRRENISRSPLPSRSVDKTCPYRPVPSTKPIATVPSRQNLSLPLNPAVKTCPYRPAPPFIAVTPSRQDAVTVKTPWILWRVTTAVLIVRVHGT